MSDNTEETGATVTPEMTHEFATQILTRTQLDVLTVAKRTGMFVKKIQWLFGEPDSSRENEVEFSVTLEYPEGK